MWKQTSPAYFHSSTVIATVPLGYGQVFAARVGGGFFVSGDRGATWTPTSGGPPGAVVRELQSDDYNRVTAVTDKGLFWSGDAGHSWTRSLTDLPDLAVSSYLFTGWTVYATTDTAVFRGLPGAWKLFSYGLPANTPFARVFLDRTGRRLCAVPSEQAGTYVYRYGYPKIRLASVPLALLVGEKLDLFLEVTPEQPEEPETLILESSDPSILAPISYPYIVPFTTRLEFPFAVRRAGTHPVTVRIKVPDQFGGSETSATLLVLNSVPKHLFLDPRVVPLGGPPLTLRIFADNNGRAFVEGSTILWNGSPRQTSFVPQWVCPDICNIGIETTILAEDIASPGLVNISVRNPPPGGGISEAVTLVVGTAPRNKPAKPGAQRPGVGVKKPRG